jgi:hypothetical protein
MSDPASRQAMLEKAFGKGSTNAFDTALAGAGGQSRVASEQERLSGIRAGVESRGAETEAARQRVEKSRAFDRAQEEMLAKRAAGAKASRDAAAAARARADEDRRVDSWARESGEGYYDGNRYNPDEQVWANPNQRAMKNLTELYTFGAVKSQNNPMESWREHARKQLQSYEKFHPGKKWKAGSGGGGGW